MTARRDAGQTGFVPAKVLRRLLQEQPTPFYLYDETMLREACEKLRLAFSWNAGFTPVFPVRMNQNPAVLRILASAGAQLLCVSEAELRLARRADADGQRIIYAPVAIDERACGYARRIGAAQLVDGEHALPPQPPARVFLSVNPGGQLCLNGRTVWNFEKSKLGMDLQTLLSMCRRFLASGTEAISPCVFLRDQDLEPARFQAALEMLLRLAVRLYQELGIGVQSVLICGGLGASYRPSEQAPDLQAVSDFVQEKYEEILAPAGLCPSGENSCGKGGRAGDESACRQAAAKAGCGAGRRLRAVSAGNCLRRNAPADGAACAGEPAKADGARGRVPLRSARSFSGHLRPAGPQARRMRSHLRRGRGRKKLCQQLWRKPRLRGIPAGAGRRGPLHPQAADDR